MKRLINLLLFAAIVTAVAHLCATANASAGLIGNCLDQTGCCRRCPACDHVCELKAEQGEEDRVCFDIESKVICIPRVVFPWQKKKCASCSSCDGNGCSHCVNNGARTRRVCVLKKSSYQCPKCKYTWSAEKAGCCRAGCAEGKCVCDAAPYSELSPAASEMPAAADQPAIQPQPQPATQAQPQPATQPQPQPATQPQPQPAQPAQPVPLPAGDQTLSLPTAYGRPLPSPLPSVGGSSLPNR